MRFHVRSEPRCLAGVFCRPKSRPLAMCQTSANGLAIPIPQWNTLIQGRASSPPK